MKIFPFIQIFVIFGTLKQSLAVNWYHWFELFSPSFASPHFSQDFWPVKDEPSARSLKINLSTYGWCFRDNIQTLSCCFHGDMTAPKIPSKRTPGGNILIDLYGSSLTHSSLRNFNDPFENLLIRLLLVIPVTLGCVTGNQRTQQRTHPVPPTFPHIALTLRIWRHHLTHMLARQNGMRVVMTVDANSHLALSGCGRTAEEAKSAAGPRGEPWDDAERV